MKINNPTVFFGNDINDSYQRDAATIMTRRDVIRKFAAFDSTTESDWHFAQDNEADSWVKFSFDAGKSYPLKFRFKNTLLMKFYYEAAPVAGTALQFDFGTYSELDYSSIRNGRISVYAVNEEGYITHLPCYRYKFNDNQKTLDIVVTMEAPADTIKTMVLVELDGHSAMAMAVPTPVFSSFASFSPMAYSDELGYHGELGIENESIVLTTNFDNVGKLSLKLSAASTTTPGNVVLKFKCGNDPEFTQTIRVTPSPSWQSIVLEKNLYGTLTITRMNGDSADTLDGDCIVSNIKIEIFS